MHTITACFQRRLWLFAAALASTLMVTPARGEAKPEIVWLMFSWPPYNYQDDDGNWAGYGYNFQRHLINALPQYEHNLIQAKYSYIPTLFRRQSNICSIGLFPSAERREFAWFSLPDQIFPPMKLWMRQDTFESLGQPVRISLEQLLHNNSGLLALKTGVAYDQSIRDVVNRSGGEHNILRLDQQEMTLPLLEMVARRRIDFMIDYSDMVAWIRNHAPDDRLHSIRGVEIEEAGKEMRYTRVACPDNETGREIINQVNRVLPTLYRNPDYWGEFLPYLTTDQKGRFNRYLERLSAKPELWTYDPNQ